MEKDVFFFIIIYVKTEKTRQRIQPVKYVKH